MHPLQRRLHQVTLKEAPKRSNSQKQRAWSGNKEEIVG